MGVFQMEMTCSQINQLKDSRDPSRRTQIKSLTFSSHAQSLPHTHSYSVSLSRMCVSERFLHVWPVGLSSECWIGL